MIETLKQQLADWTDSDIAEFYLARNLGIFGPEITKMSDVKSVFGSANPVGDALYATLRKLNDSGILDYDQDQEKFRWNPSFMK